MCIDYYLIFGMIDLTLFSEEELKRFEEKGLKKKKINFTPNKEVFKSFIVMEENNFGVLYPFIFEIMCRIEIKILHFFTKEK